MQTRNWYAWLNEMPPKPDDVHVTGEVYVPNPGMQAFLTIKEPQGINPEILLLDLHLIQQPGMWPQAFTWVQARYDSVICPGGAVYKQVGILYEGDQIELVDVDVTS